MIVKTSKIMQLLQYRLKVTLVDGRVLIGQMIAFDRYMNLVLAECEEWRTLKAKKDAAKPDATGTYNLFFSL